MVRAIGYTRVSTREQGESGNGLAAQRAAIEAECARRGWVLERIYTDVASGKSTDREELGQALAALATGLVSALTVAKLDRLSRSVKDFAELLATAERQGWALIISDLGVDTGTPSGRLVASVVSALGQWEREMVSTRTREGLAAVRAQGTRIGRSSGVPIHVVARIKRQRGEGWSFAKIANELTADQVPTGQAGRQWWPSTVRKLAN